MTGNILPQETKRITVKLKGKISTKEMTHLTNSLGGRTIHYFSLFPYIVVEIPAARINDLAASQEVAEFFEDGQMNALEQRLPWGVDRIDAEIVHSRYGIKGYGVKIAVADTGIDLNHPDLRVAGGKSFISPTYQDDNGHGTHVAGIIAALDNQIGVIGVAPEAEIYSLKVLNSSGSGYWSDLAAAMEWAIKNQIDIMTMSLGGSSADSLVKTAVKTAYKAGLLLVAAAGNAGNVEGIGDTVLYPAKFPQVIAVAATDSSDKRASFSSAGPDIELSAPGTNILSTYLGAAYRSLNGTSMAAPHVTGLAALIKSVNPGLTNDEIRKRLGETAVDLGQEGKDPFFGHGLISAIAALKDFGPKPVPPQIYFLYPKDGEILSGIKSVEIACHNLNAVESLELFINGDLAAQWNTPPYIYSWDTRKIGVGICKLTAEAVDRAGNRGQACLEVAVGVTVDIFYPGENFHVVGEIPVEVHFSNNGPVRRADLFIDGVLREGVVPTENFAEFLWDSREIRIPGTTTHMIKVVALTDQHIQTSDVTHVVCRNPVVEVTYPQENALISAEGTFIRAHITGQEKMEKVLFKVDDQVIDSLLFKPYQIYLDAARLSVGNHSIKVIASDCNGHLSESKGVLIKKPTVVNFSSPVDGQVIGGLFPVSAICSDPVLTAELIVNKKSLGNKTVNGLGPISWMVDTRSYSNLVALELEIRAVTIRDQVTSVNRIMVTVDNYSDLTAPVIRITSPPNGYQLEQQSVRIAVDARDDTSVSYVEFFVNDTSIKKAFQLPYEVVYDFDSFPTGAYHISAKAVDIAGNTGFSNKIEIIKPIVL